MRFTNLSWSTDTLCIFFAPNFINQFSKPQKDDVKALNGMDHFIRTRVVKRLILGTKVHIEKISYPYPYDLQCSLDQSVHHPSELFSKYI